MCNIPNSLAPIVPSSTILNVHQAHLQHNSCCCDLSFFLLTLSFSNIFSNPSHECGIRWISCTRHEQIYKNGKVTREFYTKKRHSPEDSFIAHGHIHNLKMVIKSWVLAVLLATLGYVGSKSFLEELLQVILQLRQVNPNIIIGG